MLKPYYDADGITLYHADCRDVLSELSHRSIDLLLTDPPYGQGFSGNGKLTRDANIRADGASQGVRVLRQACFSLLPSLKVDAHILMFCGWMAWPEFHDACASYWPKIKNALVWHKARGGMGDTKQEYARDYEVILYATQGRRPIAGRRDGAVISGYPPRFHGRQHPTEKPVELLSYLITRHAPEDGTVLDPFAGCGSTLVAAQQLGRRAIGVEIEERWCEAAAQRLSAARDVAMLTPGTGDQLI